MQDARGLKQPLLGIAGTIIAACLSLWICFLFTPSVLGSWVAQFVMSAIPLQIILGLVWHTEYPGFLGKLSQPLKGMMFLVLMAVAAVIVTPASVAAVGGHVWPPTPFVIIFTISSIVMTFWLVVVFHCWPFSAISKHPLAAGMGTFVLAYILDFVWFKLAFNFSPMKGAPFYSAAIDPQGWFPAWRLLSFMVTSVVVIMWFVMWDFWPSATIVKKVPVLGKQPLFGILTGAIVLAIAAVIWTSGIIGMHMDAVDYLVRVGVSLLFGEFILILMMETAPFQTAKQPLKGIVLYVITVILALLMHWIYQVAALRYFGHMAKGAPSYDLDLWLATAMLSITFPLIVVLNNGFGFWPLTIRKQIAGESAAKAVAGG